MLNNSSDLKDDRDEVYRRAEEKQRKRIRESHCNDSEPSASSGDEDEDVESIWTDSHTLNEMSNEEIDKKGMQWSLQLNDRTISRKCLRCNKTKSRFFGYSIACIKTDEKKLDLSIELDDGNDKDVIHMENEFAMCMDCFCSLTLISEWYHKREVEREKKRNKLR